MRANDLSIELLRKPSLLRSVCDRAIQVEHSTDDLSGMRIKRRSNELEAAEAQYGLTPSCQCQVSSIRAGSTWSTKCLSIFRSSATSGIHQKGCPLRIYSRKQTIIETRYSLCDIRLSQIISFSISITRGVRTLSISSNLSFCVIVSDDSPAFTLFNYDKF